MRRRRRGEQPDTDYSLGDRSTGPTVQLSGVKPGMTIPRIPNAGVSQDWTGEKVSIGAGPIATMISNLFDSKLRNERDKKKVEEAKARRSAARSAGGTTTPPAGGGTPTAPTTGGGRPSVPSSPTTAGGGAPSAPVTAGGTSTFSFPTTPTGPGTSAPATGTRGPGRLANQRISRNPQPTPRTYSNPAADPSFQFPISQRMTRPNLFPRRSGPEPTPVPRERLDITQPYTPPSMRQGTGRRVATPRPSLPQYTPPSTWNPRFPNLPLPPTQEAGQAARERMGLPTFEQIRSGEWQASQTPRRETEVEVANPPSIPSAALSGIVGSSPTVDLATSVGGSSLPHGSTVSNLTEWLKSNPLMPAAQQEAPAKKPRKRTPKAEGATPKPRAPRKKKATE